jgi:hypothetical protein
VIRPDRYNDIIAVFNRLPGATPSNPSKTHDDDVYGYRFHHLP